MCTQVIETLLKAIRVEPDVALKVAYISQLRRLDVKLDLTFAMVQKGDVPLDVLAHLLEVPPSVGVADVYTPGGPHELDMIDGPDLSEYNFFAV